MGEVKHVANVAAEVKPEEKGITIVNACAAKFFKKSLGATSFYESKKGQDWDLNAQICVDFVNFIEKKFSKSGKIFGYVDKVSVGAAKSYLDYVGGGDFSIFVNDVMASLCNEASDPARSSLSEGYVVFARYKASSGRDTLLVVMLGKLDGYDFVDDVNLTPKNTESLNLQDFRQAACMDLTSFAVEYPKNEGESYLYFIKGKSKSEFFTVALGCSDSVVGKVCVDNLKDALSKYMQEDGAGLTLALRRDIQVRVYDYVESRAGKTVSLSDVQVVIDKCLPEHSEFYGGFHKYLHHNSERFKVSEEFQPSHSAAKGMSYLPVKLSSGDFDGQVKYSAITVGEHQGSDVSVDSDFVYLRIKLPAAVAADIKAWHTNSK